MILNSSLNKIENPPIPHFKKKASNITPKTSQTFDMTQAVPSFPTFAKIISYLQKQLDIPENSFYTDVPGDLELRTALIKSHALSSSLSPQDLMITAGANHAAYTALTLHFNIGDKVLLPEPYYFNHDMAIKMLGLKSHHFQLDAENGFALDAEKMITAIQQSQSKGVILVTPNNPTGATYEASEVLKLLDWTSRHSVQVILDETYMKFDSRHLHLPEIGK